MRAAIYNPYLDTLGGGERYSMAVAQVFIKLGYKVDISWKNFSIKDDLEKRFGIDLSGANIVKDINRGDNYDVCFWVSDGSIPLLRAHKNFLHFQIPFHDLDEKNLINRMKLYRIDKVICNSNFTKSFIDKEYGVQSNVIYPPVDIKAFVPKKKLNLILYVGRFSQLTQSKRQDLLIDCFKEFFDTRRKMGSSRWKFILAGGVEVGEGGFVDLLREKAQGYPIKIVESPSFKELVKLYASAKIFWSAAGFGIDEIKQPEKVEHFGITVVESMSAGCVPIVYSSGGYKEIVRVKKNGFLWKTKDELLDITSELISKSKYWHELSLSAVKDSREYSYDRFEKEIELLL